ncbi:hypothetical protein PENVUL_c025G00678 [Penicillium vulpinum]|uniref:Uncharacterized protein n=1 Tax=Penicillium vulpinum TaxID=29845 RepID=A0A1V6RUX0_9EURO|nr:hypothetical protein PENVUL_c025G00678 [Penicillium vulpinum]
MASLPLPQESQNNINMSSISPEVRSLFNTVHLPLLQTTFSNKPHFPTLKFTMETAKQAVNYVAETIQGTGAEASKEAHKSVAKDSDANVSTRASAAKDALVDKKDEVSHNTKADVHKEAAKN